jgi:hypothetical protein
MRNLVMLFSVVLMLAGAVAWHYLGYDREGMRSSVRSVVQVTRMGEVARGVAWYAPRRMHQDAVPSNPAYPELPSVSRSDFVYAQ